jgi:POT family proton-dependent oligopeptide transporter
VRDWLAAHGHAAGEAWHVGFGMAALGMALGLVQYVRGGAALGAAGLPPAHEPRAWWPVLGVLAASVLAVGGAIAAGVTAAQLSGALGSALLVITVVFFAGLFLVGKWTAAERRQLLAVLALFFGASVFWSLFEQGGSTLTLFAERNTAREVLGFTIPASWFASLNAILIIVFAPLFAWGWTRLGSREPSAPAKFTLGLAFVAAGFGVLVLAALAAQSGVKVSPWWLVATYVLHTIGELCLSPVGLSAMTKLAPARIAGLTMGVWFLATSVGNYLGGRVAGLYEAFTLPQLFGAVTAFAAAAAIVMALTVGPLRRMLAERE